MEAAEIIGLILGSTALFSFLQYIITLHYTRKDKRSDVSKRLDALEAADKEIKEDVEEIKKDAGFSRRINHLNAKDRVAYLTAEGVKQGFITVSNLAYVEEAVTLLHEDGENGEMTACLETVRGLPVRQ